MFKRITTALALTTLATLMGGCCLCHTQEPLPLPPPISLQNQVQSLNARARSLPRLTAGGTVVIRWTDDQGDHKESADGRLVLQQNLGQDAAFDSGNAILFGRVAGQEVFQAGKNHDQWWFLLRLDAKKAWVGDADSPGDLSSSLGGGIFRADLVLRMLAITPLYPESDQTIAMRVNDDTRSNDLFILQLWRNGSASLKREIIVDRDSGNVRQVNLYLPTGTLFARADLKNYQPIDYKEGVDAPPGYTPQPFPCDILITYPSRKASIHFTIDKAEIPQPFKPQLFQTPDFADQGLQVVPAN